MIDHDVMVFVRKPPGFCFLSFCVDIIYQDMDKAILIIAHSVYEELRRVIINKETPILEIQLIKPRKA